MNTKLLTKILITTLLIFATSQLYSQVSIGSLKAPVKGALLDLKDDSVISTNGETARSGLCLPRVELEDVNKLIITGVEIQDVNNQYKKHTGLLVFHVSSVPNPAIPNGLYVWTGKEWESLNLN